MSTNPPRVTKKDASATSILLVGENLSRGVKGGGIEFDNRSAADLYAKAGGAASLTDYTWYIPMLSNRIQKTDFQGEIYGIWSTADTGFVNLIEDV